MMARRPMYRASFALSGLYVALCAIGCSPEGGSPIDPSATGGQGTQASGGIVGLRRGFLERGSHCFGRRGGERRFERHRR